MKHELSSCLLFTTCLERISFFKIEECDGKTTTQRVLDIGIAPLGARDVQLAHARVQLLHNDEWCAPITAL